MDRKTIGRYEIIDELGRGAMGAVLRAKDPAVGRTVALKCILSGALAGDQTNEFRERFYREARAAGALAHPGIVPVFDVGEDDGTPFLVMELVQGRTLADALKQGERFSLERVCEIGQGIAEALDYAHRNGIVHRDIKPANILMTSREVYGAERPRITDFGVAKLAGGEITTTGQLLGTPAFMPPEQFTGAPYRWPHRLVFTGSDPVPDGHRGAAVFRRDDYGGFVQDCSYRSHPAVAVESGHRCAA